MSTTMDSMKAAWPQAGKFLKELTNAGVTDETLKAAVEAALASVNSGYYSDPRLVTAEKITRFCEAALAICFGNNRAALEQFRARLSKQVPGSAPCGNIQRRE